MPEPIPPIYVNGIPCAIALPDGRVAIAEASGPEGPEITIPYKCAWADRWNLVAALRGTCTGNITNFQRSAPYSLPGFPNLVCTSVGQFGYIGSGANPDGSIFAAQAIVPATFSAVPWMFADGDPAGQNDSSGQAWTVTKVKPSAEVYQPTGGTYWIGPFASTTPLDEGSVGFIRSSQEILMTRKFLPSLDVDKYKQAIGCVNFSPITIGTTTYPTAYLLLVDVESEPYFDCLGNPVNDISQRFLGRTQASWWRVQDRNAAWQLVNSKPDGTGSAPFPTFDFTTLPR